MDEAFKTLLVEILERIERLKIEVFGMTREQAEEFLKRHDEERQGYYGSELPWRQKKRKKEGKVS